MFLDHLNSKKMCLDHPRFIHPIIFLRDLILKNYYRYKCKTFDYDSLNNLENFAYMPLLLQPEENIDLVSTDLRPNRNRKISCTTANMCLVIKDHPHMIEKRSKSYLEKLNICLM